MKIIARFILILILIIFTFLTYLSLVGIETKRLNNQIVKKIKQVDKNLDIELNEIKIVLNPFELKFKAKTVGPKIINKNRIIEIEYIKTQVSLKSLIDSKFSIENLEISTKSLEINRLISFIRSLKNTPELFILEKIIKKGYLIADIKLEFDTNGEIKKNYKIKGFIKDAKLNLIKKYNVEKLNFIFDYEKENLAFEDITFSSNDLNFFSKKINLKNTKNEFLVSGSINNKQLDINEENLKLLIKPFFSFLDIEKIKFSSKNIFSFKLNKRFKLKDFEIKSELLIDEFLVGNNLKLKKLFPKIKKSVLFSKNKLTVTYNKEGLLIKGKGDIFLQDNNDEITYIFNKKNEIFDFKSSIKIKNNPFVIDLLNYEKNPETETLIKLDGKKNKKKQILINLFSLEENKNLIMLEDLIFDKKLKIIDLSKFNLDYIDRENQKNSIRLYKKNNEHFLKGSVFNVNYLIDKLTSVENNNSNIFNIDSNINIKIDKIRLDNEYNLRKFNGNLYLKDQKIEKANLAGNFSNNKKMKFTVGNIENNKVTTLYLDKAEPIVRRYKFIKGFDEGSLDFYSSSNGSQTKSQLKIYDFKLKELPALTKILTLASLQGIADILSGEGIRFDEFEMNFKNQGNVMTIDEIFAVGPAISILMNGYIEKDKLVSLRGTLVPATTINKVIGSIPILGKILVGSKTGEGVFGVSFKIKGQSKNLETSVNPIKTLTPRFITRTLEKIKKN